MSSRQTGRHLGGTDIGTGEVHSLIPFGILWIFVSRRNSQHSVGLPLVLFLRRDRDKTSRFSVCGDSGVRTPAWIRHSWTSRF